MSSTRIKLRSACDSCHQLKVRCSGNHPCNGCINSDSLCLYSPTNRLGRPKGTKSQRTTKSGAKNSSIQRNGDTENTGKKEKLGSKQTPTTSTETCVPQQRPQSVVPQRPQSPKQSTIWFSALNEATYEPNNNEVMDMIGDDGFNTRDMGRPVPWDLKIFEDVDFGQVEQHRCQGDFNGLLSKDFNTQDDFLHELQSLSPNNTLTTSHICKDDNLAGSASSVTNPSNPNQTNPEGTGNYSSPPLPPPPSTTLNPATCTCIRHLLELIFKLKVSESCVYNSNSINGLVMPIDATLRTVQESQRCWQDLVECANCTYNDDQEFIILTFMSIRSVLRHLQRLCLQYGGEFPGNATHSFLGQAQLKEQRLSIGSLEITGDDRKLVIRLLLLNKVREIASTLVILKRVLDRKKRASGEAMAGSLRRDAPNKDIDRMLGERGKASASLFYTQQILEGLISSTKELDATLRFDI